MKILFKTSWYFFIFAAINELIRTWLYLTHPLLIQQQVFLVPYNLINIACYFFASWKVFEKTQRYSLAITSSLLIFLLCNIGLHITSILVAAHLTYHLPIQALLRQIPHFLQQEISVLAIVLILGALGARICQRRQALQAK